MNIEIKTPKGEVKNIRINHMPALDGWDIQQRFVEFAASHDKDHRKAFTIEVLAYATVIISSEVQLPLTTAALIDNHLCSWQNLQRVFEEVLLHNGIDPKTHADQPHYWSKAGAEMATSFIAEVTQLLGPALQLTKSE